MSLSDHLVLVVDLLSLVGIIGVELRVFACKAKQHGPLQVHPKFGVQVFFWCLTEDLDVKYKRL